jgi:hypothetical protein
MTESLFGQMVSGAQVEQAVIDTVDLWMPTYLREAERQFGYAENSLLNFRTIKTDNEFTKEMANQLPALVVISVGITGKPRPQGGGPILASWVVGVALVVTARKQAEAEKLSKDYAALMRTLLLQQSSLGDFAAGVAWQNESYTDIPSSEERQLASASMEFHIDVDEVSNQRAGLRTPPDDPTEVPSWPTAETVSVTTEKE